MTANQVQRLVLAHLSFKYTHMPESTRKGGARNTSHRNAAGDLAVHR